MTICKKQHRMGVPLEKANYRKRVYSAGESFRTFSVLIWVVCSLFLFNVKLAAAQLLCPANPHWTVTAPPINADHIFCGEIGSKGKAKGFHSRPGGLNPVTVANFVVTQPPNGNGIYGGTVTLVSPGRANPSKFSTIFPNNCSRAEVEQSVLYAHLHAAACPVGAPGWARCGMNRPVGGDGEGYCIGNDVNSRFYIAFSTLDNGNINTAFPLR